MRALDSGLRRNDAIENSEFLRNCLVSYEIVWVRDSGVVNEALIADLYQVSQNQVSIIPYDVAMAIKITVPRLVPSGSFGDTDIYGAQQHAPLLTIEVPD